MSDPERFDFSDDKKNQHLWGWHSWSSHREKLLKELEDGRRTYPFETRHWTAWWRGWKAMDFIDGGLMVIGVLSFFAGGIIATEQTDLPMLVSVPFLALPLLLFMKHKIDRQSDKRFILMGERERWILRQVAEANAELEYIYLEETG